jgi:hypothetical protein
VELFDEVAAVIEIGHGPGQSTNPVESAGAERSGTDLPFENAGGRWAHRGHRIQR